MIDGVEVAENPRRSDSCTNQQVRQCAFPGQKFSLLAQKHHQRKGQRNQIPEKTLLNKRQIAGKPDKGVHPGKTKGRQDDTKRPLLPIG